jgi:molybdopterin/thiamine biosynthesis adenylyltransferase
MSELAAGDPPPAHPAAQAAEQLRLTCAAARDDLADALARARFRRCDDALPDCDGPGWRGTLTFTTDGDTDARRRATVVDVVVPEDYPFRAPRIHPGNRVWAEVATGRTFGDEYYEPGRGWHREADLALCLFDDADHTLLPWADGAALLQQATAWLAADAAGWPDDAPALDLERYLEAADEQRVLLYGALNGLDGAVLRCHARRNGVLRLTGPAGQHRSGRRSGSRRWGPDAVWVAAAGELTRPIRDWDDLRAAVGPDRAQAPTRAQRAGLRRVLLTYTRRGVPAALALELAPGPDRTVQLRALRSAPDDRATRAIRAGRDAADLGRRRVAIIGVGAVGSVVADLLHRGGVGQLQLIDADRLLPGNTTRHLLGERAVGLPKARAVADTLRAARPLHGQVSTQVATLGTTADAADLLAAFDVVVDATADSTATAMLTTAAAAGAGQLLSVAVLADGHAVRVDRTPPPDGQQPLPAPQLPPPSPTVYEAGCGSPVSTTPPWAAWEAAAIAARHTIGLLTDPDSVPAGEERLLTFAGGHR